MKNILYTFMLIALVVTACKQKSSNTTADANTTTNEREILLAGDVQKTWKAQREENAAGDKERLDRSERQERVIFYRNHNVTMTSNDASRQGKWTLENNQLGLQFENTDVIESFEVLELDKNTLHLKAGDGSEMKFKPE